MPSSNVYQLGFALQSAKGTAAAAPQYLIDVTDADVMPNIEIEEREETGLGRDVGDNYIQVLSVEGSASIICRPKTTALFLYGVLGAKAVTGAADPYTHTLTPAADQPWFTVWRTLAGSIHEHYTDCKITQTEFEWEAGGDLTCSMDIMGLSFERLASMPAGGVYEQGQPLRVPGMEYSIETVVNDAITGGSLTIEAAQEALQTVQIYNSYLEPSRREITASYDEIYQNVERYAKIIYGAADGLTPTETIYEGALQFTFGDYTDGPGLRFVIPRFQFSEIEAEPDSGGDPLVTPVSGKAARPVSGSILTATVLNSVASYPVAA